MAKCKVCKEEIHPLRAKFGYDTCVQHSKAEKYTGIISATGKSDYELHVIKDPELARHLKEISPVYQ